MDYDASSHPPSKRRRTPDDGFDDAGGQLVITYQEQQRDEEAIRTSSLNSPTLRLTGHRGSIYALSYDPTGQFLCSASFDTTCLLWNATGSCGNYNVLEGHKNAVLDVKWTVDSERIITASADKLIGFWDSSTGERIKRFVGHEGVVNAVDADPTTPSVVCSAGDDATVRMWDCRVKRGGQVCSLEHSYPVTAVAFALDGNTVYSGGIDNEIHAWDIRQGDSSERMMTMKGHQDTITCLSIHPQGTHLLSHSMDASIRSWDVRPFVPSGSKRHCKTFLGATHGAEKGLLNCAWSTDGNMVTGGSADRVVHIWDEVTAEELYCLPGHKGCVNTVVFHPKENVVASGSSDKTIYVGELAQ